MLRPASVLGNNASDQPERRVAKPLPVDTACPLFTGRSMLRPYKTGIWLAQLDDDRMRRRRVDDRWSRLVAVETL
jgi:hypothetical protein